MINNLNPLGASSQTNNSVLSKGAGVLNKLQTKDGVLPSDSYAVGEPPEGGASMANLASAVLDAKGIKSKEFKYSIKDVKSAPDGSHYVAYSDWSKPKGNYITSLDPDGKVKWEITAGPDGLRSIAPGKNGFLFVETGKGIMGVNSDGSESFRLPLDGQLKSPRVDRNGNLLFRTTRDQKLKSIDINGKEAAIPLKLKAAVIHQFKENADGTAWVRNRNTISRLDMNTGDKLDSIKFTSPQAKQPFNPDDFFPTADGGMLVRATQSIVINNPVYNPGDLHTGLGFGGWRPHLPPVDDYSSMYHTIEKVRLFKVDAQGEQTWMSEDLGSNPKVAFSPAKQRVLCAQNSVNSEGNCTVYSYDLKGNRQPFVVMKGYIRQVEDRESDGNVFVRSDDKLDRYDADGKLLNSLPLKNDLKGAKLAQVQQGAGRPVVLQSSDNKQAFRWDPDKDQFTCITDHKRDYSFLNVKPGAGEPAMAEPGADPSVEVGEKFIIIDGVKIPVND